MGEDIPCPVCTLYLRPGMVLADHLETHPKEQVIKALVKLARLNVDLTTTTARQTKTPVLTSEESAVALKAEECSKLSNFQPQEHPLCSVTSYQEPLSKETQQISTAAIAKKEQENVSIDYALNLEKGNYTAKFGGNQPLTIQQPSSSQNFMNINKQSTLVKPFNNIPSNPNAFNNLHYQRNGIHQNTSFEFGSPPPLQMFSYQNHTKHLQPPPAYGAAISQLRSQNSQNYQINKSRQTTNFATNHYINSEYNTNHSYTTNIYTNPQGTLDYSVSKNYNIPYPSRPLSTNPSRMASGSPSVLRFAESPITAQYLERANGDFIVQEVPRHVVQCVEKDNGEFSVIEKVLHSSPSVVQITSENENNNKNANKLEENENSASSLMSQKDNTTKEEKKDDTSLIHKPCGITVLSDVQLNLNEYLDLVGTMFASNNKNIKTEPFSIKTENDRDEIANITSFNQPNSAEKEQQYFDSLSILPPPSPNANNCLSSPPTSVIRLAKNVAKPHSSGSKREPQEKKIKTPDNASKKSEIKSVVRDHPPVKRQYTKIPKKLVIKTKNQPKEKELQLSSSSNIKEEPFDKSRLSPQPGPSNRVANKKDLMQPTHPTEPNEQIDVHNVEVGDSEVLSSEIKMDCVPEEEMITSFVINEDIVETSNIDSKLNLTSSSSLSVLSSLRGEAVTNLSMICNSDSSTNFEANTTAKAETKLSTLLQDVLKREDCKQDANVINISSSLSSVVENSCYSDNKPPTSFPSATLFSKPSASTTSIPPGMQLSTKEENNTIADQHQQIQPHLNYSDYPFSFLYAQSDQRKGYSPIYQSEEQIFNKYNGPLFHSQTHELEDDHKNSYLDLDACKRSDMSSSFQESVEPMVIDTLNIRTDEKMPAKGEISEQESNGDIENSWSQPVYNELACRFPNPYDTFMSRESWSLSHDDYFHPQDLTSTNKLKGPSTSAVLNSNDGIFADSIPSSSKKKKKKNDILAGISTETQLQPTTSVGTKKTFKCVHCKSIFPKLKERNTHLIDLHGYKRVNRRLIREPPSSTVTTATLNLLPPPIPELPLFDASSVVTTALDTDSKSSIIKFEISHLDECDEKKPDVEVVSVRQDSTFPRTKYDSIRAGVYRMLMNFNLSVLKQNTNVDIDEYLFQSKSFCCYTCKRDFISVKLFDEHLAEHPAECFTCGKKFSRWTYFSIHLKRHLGWKDFACTVCEKKFVIRGALVEHMRMHTGVTPLKCKICNKHFKRYSNLTQHKKICHTHRMPRKKEFVCHCGEVLPSKARFLWHKETHDSKPKCCPYCRDRFIHANSLRRHIRMAHSDKFSYTEPMECPICQQIYAKSSIKVHMATHSMDTQHECHICNKSFSTKWNLKIHSWVHASRTAKPFKCDHCPKAFVREIDYKNHLNAHKQIKPYTCEFCGCKFIRKYNYMRHRREHHGKKKFRCDLCSKLFHRHYYLIEHRRIHTGERPFLCTICGKSSTTKTNHNKHLKIHHSRDPFTSES